ncbi:DUF2922 domain-containing protein [Candidatus Enterococcus murrayae]|uniref:DUF2922 domain-containing protein n=1 Tax=Candidatus Enterococcus murrayae TaxID=2815321 RepID=A0ABS3HH99_9ENTE|nr:DUF2922 domain-containing protein [Enterococcus sp. MJM16]MBO0452826.1 DUF2922 domain-containing protein [Enterococcus sp. MJM16]
MFTLDAEFENSNGKSQHLRFKNVDPTKTGAEIKASLTKLTQLNLFERKGVGLYKKVKHATLVETIETELFDDSLKPAAEPSIQAEAPVRAVEETRPEPEMAEDAQPATMLQVSEEKPEPNVLIQTIELPAEMNPREMYQSEALSIITACVPDGYTLEDIQIDDTEQPAKLILTERRKVAESAEIPQAPPPTPKKKRKRLLDRIRKRE